MPLELKSKCEKCPNTLSPESAAFICTYECTFCEDCAAAMDYVCPNCGGELVRRPRKKSKVSFVLAFSDDEPAGAEPSTKVPKKSKTRGSRQPKRSSK